ncbi:MAG: GNAT family N-acetyltransferase, partial [Candidatus Thorarchaeota archaeon]|nr:GNAT family N-acetyltransferase [Candidatus Thorarchaeota archaeon]
MFEQVDSNKSEMPDPANIRIIEYSDDYAAAFAKMFNSWNDLWPGGFTQGVPYTEDRVKNQYGKMKAIALLFALDSETNTPLGMCTLHDHWRDIDAAYVGTLGVSPEALNRKVGKRLLLEAIEIVTKKGKTRVDLNTWPGNMRAVPLYKKVGLMWNPTGDGVQMEDYLPGILNHPVCRPFFNELSSEKTWYDAHVREIVQAPDAYSEDGMDVFPYRFENGNDSLSVVVDKHSRDITSIEKSTNWQSLKIVAKVSNHNVLCGVPTDYTLEIENKSNEALEVPIKLEGFKGLSFSADSTTTLKIPANENAIWVVPFVLGSDASIHRKNLRTPVIDAELKIDGEKCHLKTGLVIKPLAEVRMRLDETRISPGGKSSVPLSILSASTEKWSGTIHIESPSPLLKITPSEHSIEMPAEGFAGVEVTSKADDGLETGTYDLWAHMTLSNNGNQITTRKFRVPVYCLDIGAIAIGQDDRLLQKTAANDNYFATFADEGAILRLRSASGTRMGAFMLRSQIGPPFGIDTFRFAPRKFENKDIKGNKVLSMKAKHPERPLLVEDRATFEKGTGVVIHELWVTNTGKDSHTLQARIYGGGGGISLNPGRSWLPLKDGVIEEAVGEGFFSYPVLPGNPEAFSEGW